LKMPDTTTLVHISVYSFNSSSNSSLRALNKQ
jgi:hypothetical protein